jgi:predicted RNA-binding protein YlqC (UPF0109 family)
MSESQSSSQPQWGRNPKRKNKYGAPKSAEGGGAPLGPVDDPTVIATAAATIIRSERPATPPPAPRAPRENRNPDETDEKLRDLVVHLAKGLVDHPDAVDVEIVSAGNGGMLELQVHADDIGHVIGKQGRTARSLRLTLEAAAGRVDRRMALEIAD